MKTLLLGFLLAFQYVSADVVRNVPEYNLQSGLGLNGFDPVAIFPEGGSAPKEGLPGLTLEFEGVVYRFASVDHRDMFAANPAKYEPTYGGWCAYAMASGSKVDIQPQLFTIQGNRAHYFVSSRAKQNFDRDLSAYEVNADRNWKTISGEDPRL